MAEGQGGDKGYQFACSLKELEQLGRKRVTVEERVVVVFHIKGQIYAMDHFCYRKLTKRFINTDTTDSISISNYHSIRILFITDAGGPLELGDIEVHRQISIMAALLINECLFTIIIMQDSHGRLCVVCPWHKHTITLDTGESLYTAFDPMNPKKLKHNCSKGVKQVRP